MNSPENGEEDGQIPKGFLGWGVAFDLELRAK